MMETEAPEEKIVTPTHELTIRETPAEKLGVMALAEKAAAEARIQVGYVVARRFPRKVHDAIAAIRLECENYELAEEATYSYKRGDTKIRQPSIRLAEVLARNWGNLDFGTRELEHVDGINGRSVVEAFCTDFEKNVTQSRTFTVHHKVKLKAKGNRPAATKHLDDPRDVWEHVANYGARRMRTCILRTIPRTVVQTAMEAVDATLAKGPKGVSFQETVSKMVIAFQERFTVTPEMLERYLGHPLTTIDGAELADLRGVFTALKDGEATRQDYFELRAEPEGGKAAELTQRAQEVTQ